ncbi:hypothetical protein [Chromohalobacter israelensis]|uniref:hypothetical protein n=1 Tax=Chromohalobacter israelensis TaxID=141390 RepID=UPI00265BDEFC|nr:hypothetical protein [Chromohalobacter salexigens]MDO0944172.1 hypothetical protein [Chromohalobacter salexigens]
MYLVLSPWGDDVVENTAAGKIAASLAEKRACDSGGKSDGETSNHFFVEYIIFDRLKLLLMF